MTDVTRQRGNDTNTQVSRRVLEDEHCMLLNIVRKQEAALERIVNLSGTNELVRNIAREALSS